MAAPSTVAVIDPFVEPGSTVVDHRVRPLLDVARMVPVVAVVPFAAEYREAVRSLFDHGLTEIADAAFEDDASSLPMRLSSVHAQPLKRAVETALSRFVSVDALTLIRAAAEIAVDRGSALGLAQLLDSNERTVAGWCLREHLPRPGRLLAWLRLLLALALLEDSGRNVSDAAACAGYTGHSLRRALRQFLGEKAPTREWRLNDGLSAFNSELRELREKARGDRQRRFTS